MNGVCTARVLVGGKLRDFQGHLPGLIEEALLAMREQTPLLLVGGFGGASLEVLRAMEPGLAEWLPPSLETQWKPDEPAREALAEIHSLWLRGGKQMMDRRVMSELAMRKLATTYRPSEIATLVGQALARLVFTTPA